MSVDLEQLARIVDPDAKGTQCHCPLHEDDRMSGQVCLSKKSDRPYLACYADCNFDELQKVFRQRVKDAGLEDLLGKRSLGRPPKSKNDEVWTLLPHAPEGMEFTKVPYKDYKTGVDYGYSDHVYFYKSSADTIDFAMQRWDQTGKRGKEIRPVTPWRHVEGIEAWRIKGPKAPRTLYEQYRLAERPDAPVLWVEGEKTAIAAQAQFPDYVVITNSQGVGSVGQSNWAPLEDRQLTIWPDNDEPGRRAIQSVGAEAFNAKAASIAFVEVPEGLEVGWDLADPIPDWFDPRAALDAAMPWSVEAHGGHKKLAVEGGNLPAFSIGGDELMEKLNSRFFVIVNSTSLVVEIIRQEQGVLEFNDYSPEGFRLKYCNKFVDIGDDKSITLAKYFLTHPRRRDYRKRIFAPGRTLGPDEFNTFPGFPISPTETGDCSLFWQHLEQNYCAGYKIVYIYIRKWIAHIFQKPGEKSGVAVVTVSKERGAGKTIVADILNVLLGDSLFVRIDNQNSLTGDFTKHRDNKLLINFEESINPNDPRAASVLKNLITGGKRLSHEKFHTPETVETFERILMTSNEEEEAVHVEQGDRRVLVNKATPGWSTPHPTNANEWMPNLIERDGKMISIFKAMLDDLVAGGYGRLMYDIMAEDLSDFNAWDFPRTEARAQQSLGSLSVELQFYYNVLAERADEFFMSERLLKEALYSAFTTFARNASRSYKISNVKFGRELSKVWPETLKEPVPGAEGKTRFKVDRSERNGPLQYVLGTIKEHREAFTANTSIPFDYDYDDVEASGHDLF